LAIAPVLQTERLLLRPFEERDLQAIFQIYSDRETNRFLPWFPASCLEEARDIFVQRYREPSGWRYALCLREENIPIGYAHIGGEAPWDLGYGLRREFWGRGLAAEAAQAAADQARREGLPYLTATHDVENPRSGAVMRKLGMTYRYSYQEFWQPKNKTVIFRLYQLNFRCSEDWTWRGYWESSPWAFVEQGLGRASERSRLAGAERRIL
jgi:RimJ/RimL family protein N-acetyltransferase